MRKFAPKNKEEFEAVVKIAAAKGYKTIGNQSLDYEKSGRRLRISGGQITGDGTSKPWPLCDTILDFLQPKKVTYSIGQKFRSGCRDYILHRTGSSQVQMLRADGKGYWSCPVDVSNVRSITEAEIKRIAGSEMSLV